MQAVVLGGGSWGTALANVLSKNLQSVYLLVRSMDHANSINKDHINYKYLPDLKLSNNIIATTDPSILKDADVCVITTPCQFIRSTLEELKPYISSKLIPVCASKGIEVKNLCRMEDVISQVIPFVSSNYAIISGPSFAKEVIENLPTAVVVGSRNKDIAEKLQVLFSSDSFRVYTSLDVAGVELGGALKNCIAIAAGISDGLGFGENSRSALITRGLAEISRLGEAFGANSLTFMGLSGIGDLILTCSGNLSRNRQVGLRLGKGEKINHIINDMKYVAEGVETTKAAYAIAKSFKVDIPIINSMYKILFENEHPKNTVINLMSRALKTE